MHSTQNLNDGYLGSGLYIQRSIQKHGRDAHVREVLEIFETREDLVFAEIALITEDLMSDPLCMIMKSGGLGGFPKMMQSWSKGKKFSDDHRKNLSEAHTGKILTPEHIQNITDATKARWADPEYKLKLKESMERYYSDDTARQKMSESVSKAWECPVLRAEQSQRLRRILGTPEQRAVKSHIANARWADPAFREKQKASRMGQKWMHHPEHGMTKVKPADIEKFVSEGWVAGRGKLNKEVKV